MTYIYALTDPDGMPRYVGQSVDPQARLASHLSRHASVAVRQWVDSLRTRGEQPRLTVLYKVSDGESPSDLEKQFIRLLGSAGKLINFRPGKDSDVLPGATALRDWMHHRGLTQSTLASMLGTEQSVVSRWV